MSAPMSLLGRCSSWPHHRPAGRLYQAAELDGASILARFRYLTLPAAAPDHLLAASSPQSGACRSSTPLSSLTNGGPGTATTRSSIASALRVRLQQQGRLASAISLGSDRRHPGADPDQIAPAARSGASTDDASLEAPPRSRHEPEKRIAADHARARRRRRRNELARTACWRS